jgi:E3 SUMO-protein ligase PIAS1
VEAVTIDPDGKWSMVAEASNSSVPDSSDDEADNTKVVQVMNGRSRRSIATPVLSVGPSFRDESGRISNKRPISQIIDLTLSEDDNEPPRPSKRHTAFPTPSSVEPRSGFQGSESEAPSEQSLVGILAPHYNLYGAG